VVAGVEVTADPLGCAGHGSEAGENREQHHGLHAHVRHPIARNADRVRDKRQHEHRHPRRRRQPGEIDPFKVHFFPHLPRIDR